MWQRHMEASGVSEEDVTEAQRFSLRFIASRDFSTPLEVLDIDHFGAKAVSNRLVTGNFEDDVAGLRRAAFRVHDRQHLIARTTKVHHRRKSSTYVL